MDSVNTIFLWTPYLSLDLDFLQIISEKLYKVSPERHSSNLHPNQLSNLDQYQKENF